MRKFALALIAVVLCGCSSTDSNPSTSTGTADKPKEKPSAQSNGEAVRFALVPSEDGEKMVEGFEPIRAQMEKDLGRKVEIVKVTDYGSVIEAMKSGKLDVAWYGPLSMVLAKQQCDAVPFAAANIKGKGMAYHSLFVTRIDTGINKPSDMAGKKVAFVDPGSTSGNLIPRNYVMTEFKKKAEEFFKEVTYAGSHDASLLALANKSVDVCAVQDITFDDKVAKKEIDEKNFKILVKSAPLPPSPLAHRKDLDAALVAAILKSLTEMDKKGIKMSVPGQGDIIAFQPLTYVNYEPIETMAKTLGLSAAQMSK